MLKRKLTKSIGEYAEKKINSGEWTWAKHWQSNRIRRGDSKAKGKLEDSPETPDRGTTSDIPSLPLGALQDAMTRTVEKKEVKEQGRNFNGKVPGNKQGMQSYILTQIRQRGPYASHFGLETENVQIIICIHRLCMVVPSIVIQQEYFSASSLSLSELSHVG